MVSQEQPRTELNDINAFRVPRLELNLYQAPHPLLGQPLYPPTPKTPAEWFSYKYQEEAKIYGCPFLEHRQPLVTSFDAVTPLDINLDFFAAILKGNPELGHSVLYYEPEMQWYFKDWDGIYKITSSEKLQNYIRALILKCAQEMPRDVQLLNLFNKYRADTTTKQIIHRAKSILAADESFFSANSPNQRKEGPELPERLARLFIESMLEKRPGSILTVTQAYSLFCGLSQQKNLQPLKRSDFKQMMADMMKDAFGISLRRDIENSEGKQQEGWKNIGTTVEIPKNETLAA